MRVPAIQRDGLSGWAALVANNINAQRPIAGNGLSIKNNSYGSVISAPNAIDINCLVWRGEYDSDAEYFVNDVVTTNPNVTYTAYDGTTLNMDSSDVSGYDQCPISYGCFVCVKYVPPSWADQDYYISQIADSYTNTTNVESAISDAIRWNEYNIYYPIYPSIPSGSAVQVTLGGNCPITANDTYWASLVGGSSKISSCTNNKVTSMYVLGAKSGSVFYSGYLPYLEG